MEEDGGDGGAIGMWIGAQGADSVRETGGRHDAEGDVMQAPEPEAGGVRHLGGVSGGVGSGPSHVLLLRDVVQEETVPRSQGPALCLPLLQCIPGLKNNLSRHIFITQTLTFSVRGDEQRLRDDDP